MRLRARKILSYIVPVAVLMVALTLFLRHTSKREIQRTEERLIATIVELSVAQKMFMQLPESYDSARDEILERNGFSLRDLEALKETYGDDPDKWVTIWQEVVKGLEELQQQPGGKPVESKKPPRRKEREAPSP